MSIRRVLPLALLVFVACSGHTQEQPVTGWTYTCDANPLGDQWADPDFTKLNDGDKNPSKSAIFSGGRVVIEITLPEETRVRRVVAQVQRHNDNYKLTKTTVEALQAGQFVQVGANNEGFWGPTAQSAFTIAIPVDVTTRKLRVIFHAASIVSIQEIELFGEPHQQADTGEYALAFDNSPGARATEVDADNDGRSELVLENPWVRLVFEPEGGLCRSFALKDAGAELVGGSGRFGLLRDQLWSPNYSFAERGYFSEIETTPQKARIDLWTQGLGGMLAFTEIRKSISLDPESPVVRVKYRLTNDQNSQTEYSYGLWSHHFLGVRGQDATYFFPTTSGVVEERFEAGKPLETWHWDPARGWAAYVADNGVGLAVSVEYRILNCFYMWAGAGTAIPTFEWRYNLLPLRAGESLETDVTFLPFEGLKRVDGVVGATVGGIEIKADDPAVVRINLGAVQVDGAEGIEIALRTRPLPDGDWKDLGRFPLADGRLNQEATIELGPGAYVANCVVYSGAQAIGEFERPFTVGGAKLAYKLEPLGERIGTSGPAQTVQHKGHELSTEIETPHVKWAKPYFSGPIRALVLCDDRYSREVIELWQRLELEFDYVKFFTTLDKEWLYHGDRSILTLEAAQRRLAEKLEKDYDVIILSGLKWDHHFTPELRRTIADKVEAGAGLVYIEPEGLKPDDELQGVCGIPDGDKRNLNAWGKWEQVAEHYITSGLPWDTLPRTRAMPFTTPPQGDVLANYAGQSTQPLIVAGKLGQGRVVTLTYDTLTHTPGYRGFSALTPAISYRGNYNLPDEMAKVTWDYFEHWWALLCRCATWAAAKNLDLRFQDFQVNDDLSQVSARIVGDLDAPELRDAVLEWVFRDRFSNLIATAKSRPEASISVAVPDRLRAGKCFVDLILRDSAGASLAWGAFSFDGPTSPALEEISVEQKTITDTVSLVPKGQPWYRAFRSNVPLRLNCRVSLVEPVGEPATVTAKLTDCHGRLLFQNSVTVTRAQTTLTFEARPPVLYNNGMRWDLVLSRGDRVYDTGEAYLIAIPPRELDRLTLTSWGGQHLWRCQYLFDEMRPLVENLGLDVAMNGESEITTGKVWWDYYQNIDHSLLGILSYLGRDVPEFMDRDYAKKAAEYAKTKDKQWLVRNPSLKDPAYLSALVDGIRKTKLQLVKQFGGAYDFCMGDEMSLTYYTQYFDFDFSQHSLAAFRDWLQQRYVSLEDLNEQWETSFATWDAVMPMTLDEVKGRPNAAPWAEFRDFMNDSLAEYYTLVQDTIRSEYPGAQCGLSGTQEPKPGNGMDWWQNSKAFSYYHSYNTGWSDEMRRSFQPHTGVRCSPYRCGYWQAGQGLEYNMFWCLLHDTKGISAWTTPIFFYGDFTYSESGRDTRANIRELKAGLWDAIRQAKRRHDRIAIHYSHPSINAALLAGKDQHIVKVRDSWVKLIEDLGLQYDFVSYAQIEEGILNNPPSEDFRYSLLILPESLALSEKEVAEIRAFVENGGGILGDQAIGLMDAKCRRQPEGLLDEVFGIQRIADQQTLKPGLVLDSIESELRLPAAEPKVRAESATSHGRAVDSDVPVVLINRWGRGTAAYLNIDLAEFDNERKFGTATEKGMRTVLLGVLESFGIEPPYPVTLASGRAPHVEVIRYEAGPLEYLGLLRERQDEEDDTAQVPLGRPRHVYDLRSGQYLGQLDTITAPMQTGDCRVYCLADQKLNSPTVQANIGTDRTVTCIVHIPPAMDRERQVVRLRFLRPDRTECEDYSRNLLLEGQPLTVRTQLALNDQPGEWTVEAVPICGGEDSAARSQFSLPK